MENCILHDGSPKKKKKCKKKKEKKRKKKKNLLYLSTNITNSKIPEFDQRPDVSRRSLGHSNLWPNLLMAEFQPR